MRLALLLSVLSASAFAGPVGLSVGETKNVRVSQRVARVDVSDGSRVEISHHGQQIRLTGKEMGRTTVNVTTVDGAEVALDVHVVSPGGRVFSVEQKTVGTQRVARSEKQETKPAAVPADAQAADVP